MSWYMRPNCRLALSSANCMPSMLLVLIMPDCGGAGRGGGAGLGLGGRGDGGAVQEEEDGPPAGNEGASRACQISSMWSELPEIQPGLKGVEGAPICVESERMRFPPEMPMVTAGEGTAGASGGERRGSATSQPQRA